jgi:PPM family protein phosphatase
MIKVDEISAISGIGKRSENEDHKGVFDNKVFIVCDGVGGSEKGEIASELVVNTFLVGFKENFSAEIINLIQKTDQVFTKYMNENPESYGMASTLTLSLVRTDGIFVAWCGDSRVYQFRAGKILFRTTDHSWVNEALQAGVITSEEAVNHPKSNVITRAIQGLHKPAQPDTIFLNDINTGDLFFHCSDGILEAWSEPELQILFGKFTDPVEITSALEKKCTQYSKDNFTAIVYQIEKTQFTSTLKQKSSVVPGIRKAKLYTSKRKLLIITAFIILIFAVLAAVIFLPQYFRKSNNKQIDSKTEANGAKKILSGKPL